MYEEMRRPECRSRDDLEVLFIIPVDCQLKGAAIGLLFVTRGDRSRYRE